MSQKDDKSSDNYESLASLQLNKEKCKEVVSDCRKMFRSYSEIQNDLVTFCTEVGEKWAGDAAALGERGIVLGKKIVENLGKIAEGMLNIGPTKQYQEDLITKILANSVFFLCLSGIGSFIGAYILNNIIPLFVVDFGIMLIVLFIIPGLACWSIKKQTNRRRAASFVFIQGVFIGYILQVTYLDSPWMILSPILVSFLYPSLVEFGIDRLKLIGACFATAFVAHLAYCFVMVHMSFGYLLLTILYSTLPILLIQFVIESSSKIDVNAIFYAMHYAMVTAVLKMIAIYLFGMTSEQYSSSKN